MLSYRKNVLKHTVVVMNSPLTDATIVPSHATSEGTRRRQFLWENRRLFWRSRGSLILEHIILELISIRGHGDEDTCDSGFDLCHIFAQNSSRGCSSRHLTLIFLLVITRELRNSDLFQTLEDFQQLPT